MNVANLIQWNEAYMYRFLQSILEYLSGEWMLTKYGKANGGTVIFIRSLYITVIIVLFTAILGCFFDVLKTEAAGKITWIGATFAAIYAALYSRFASQWIYLSNLYNSIKETEITGQINGKDKKCMAEWKAGFIEDSENLHMANKRNFAPIIVVWGKNKKVKKAFGRNTPGGKNRLIKLMKAANETYELIEKQYKA